jgi:hypothetical protein
MVFFLSTVGMHGNLLNQEKTGRLETFPPKKLHTESQVDADVCKRATDSNMMNEEEENEELGGHFILSLDAILCINDKS